MIVADDLPPLVAAFGYGGVAFCLVAIIMLLRQK